jgi:hypothetical protein
MIHVNSEVETKTKIAPLIALPSQNYGLKTLPIPFASISVSANQYLIDDRSTIELLQKSSIATPNIS